MRARTGAGHRPARPDLCRLSARERDVLRLLVEGRTDREIGATLSISRKTASNHVANILAKLMVGQRTAAVARALHNGPI